MNRYDIGIKYPPKEGYDNNLSLLYLTLAVFHVFLFTREKYLVAATLYYLLNKCLTSRHLGIKGSGRYNPLRPRRRVVTVWYIQI